MASKIKTKFKKFIRAAFSIGVLLFQLSLLIIMVYRVVPIPVTPLMIVRDAPINYQWTALENVNPNFCKAILVAEDTYFLDHYGFDFKQIKEAIKQKGKGKKLRGASTISQQTAKNLFFTPTRSWVRKGLETYVTLLIETFWSKHRIMEVYINIIEMGDGIYGVKAASLKYYKKSPAKLTKAESALLVACFPNPRRWTPLKSSNYIAKKQQRYIRFMAGFEPFPDWWFKK